MLFARKSPEHLDFVFSIIGCKKTMRPFSMRESLIIWLTNWLIDWLIDIYIQTSMIRYFTSTREENFFHEVRNRLQLSAKSTREKWVLCLPIPQQNLCQQYLSCWTMLASDINISLLIDALSCVFTTKCIFLINLLYCAFENIIPRNVSLCKV